MLHKNIRRLLTWSAILLLLLGLKSYEAASAQRRAPQRGNQPRQSEGCNKNEFTCEDNQCIPLSAVCDGLNDCHDGTDESTEHCIVIQTGPCSSRRRTKDFCNQTPDRVTIEEQNVTHQFLCHSDSLKKEKSIPLTCSNQVWTPNTLCTRICDRIVLPTSNVTCLRDGKKVDCTQPLTVGTKIYPRCDFYYRPSAKEVVCNENGEWSEKTIHCVAECGRQFKDKMRYTREMRSAEFREFPWSASIYYTKPGTTIPILFPGTIVSPYLIITTAINLYSDYQEEILTTESVNVVVAKRTKELEAMDDQFQKSYNVRNIYFTETGFQNSDKSLSSDNIVLIELDEKLVLSPSVYPACVNWDNNDTLFLKDEDIGQVPHTLTIHEANAAATTQHEILQTIALRFVSREQCINTDAMKSIPHVVRTDNFCGEPISAPAPCDGAFIFLETNTNRFYVQGLVDGVTPSMDTPPTFTNTFVDLAAHMDWINAVRKNNEDRLVNDELVLEATAADPASVCAKDNDVDTNSEIDVRFGKGKETGSEEDNKENKSVEGCLLPPKASLNANNYSVSCPVNTENNSCRRIKENTTVPEYTSLKLGCKEGFSVDTSNEEMVCFKGKWNPELVSCTRICDKLPKFNEGNFTCYEEEEQVKCNVGLKVGSKIVPQCNAAYNTERDTEAHEFVCQEDGKWIGTLPKCIKKSTKGGTPSKSNARPGTQPKGSQPSLHPRSPSYTPPNSKNSNQTSPNSKGPSQSRPSQPHTKLQETGPPKSNQSPNNTKGADSRYGKSPNNTQTGAHPRSNQSPSNAQAGAKPKSTKSQAGAQPRRPSDEQEDNKSQSGDSQKEDQNEDTNDDKNKEKDNENKKCSDEEFSCGKLCIPNSAVCNGTAECDDGTDESPESCKVLSTTSCTAKTASENYCDSQAAQNTNSRNRATNENPAFLCNTKYVNETEGIPLNCVDGISIPSTIPCIRVCKNVTLIASGLDCYRNNVTVDCKKPLLSGSKVVPRCEPGYRANFNETTCDEMGEWDHSIIECIPECGKRAKNNTKLAKTIRPAQFREFPWNVAVYKKTEDTPILFAGIIISPYLVLTNSHCCAKEMSDNESVDMFEVVVGKRSSTLDIEDDDFQKTIKVKAIHLADKADPNMEGLAIVELAEKVTSCSAVQAACVNWHKNETLTPKDGTLGLVAHWRTRDKNNSDTTHEMLQAVAMTLRNREICPKRIPKDFVKFLTKDAFCVEPISMLTPAHRGAGFIYEDKDTKLNYLQGIIYFTGIQKGKTATFTNMFLNVTTHIDWINSIRRKTEKRLHRDWVLNTRVVESNDICKSSDVNSEKNDNQDDVNSRSNMTANNKPDDFIANGCELPDKTWLYLDYNVSCLPSRQEKECKKAESGSMLPEFSSLTLSCNEGYVTNETNEVICFRKQWSPPIEPCKKICDKLELENVTLKCFWEDKRIDCDSELLSGTTAVVECAPYHQSQKSLPKLVCDEYGRWKDASEVACSYFNPWNEQGEYFKYTMQI